MGQPSWMQVTPSSVNSDYVRSFINDHDSLRQSFDPSLATSADHASALKQLSTLYGTAMTDNNLSGDERDGLASLMSNTNGAAVDAYYDNLGAQFGVGLDTGYYNTDDASVPTSTDDATTTTSGSDDSTTSSTTGAEPRRAADGRIIYDAAPSIESVRNGDGTIGLGQKGEELRDIQQQLFDGGHYEGLYDGGATADQVVDGMYGDKTTAAVEAWQTANGLEANGRLNGAQLDALLNGTAPETGSTTTDGTTTDAVSGDNGARNNDGWWTSPQEDGLAGFDVDGEFFQQNRADIFAGTTEDTQIRNSSGRIVADGATTTGAGLEYNGTIAGFDANIGDAQGTGVEYRLAAEADVYAGGEVSTTDGTIAAKGGAYAGVDVEEQFSFGARYFGIGARATAGVGAGATAEGHIGYEDGRFSVGGFAKGGLGVTGGAGGDLWVDFGQVKDDALAAGGWVADKVSGWFSGIDLSRN